ERTSPPPSRVRAGLRKRHRAAARPQGRRADGTRSAAPGHPRGTGEHRRAVGGAGLGRRAIRARAGSPAGRRFGARRHRAGPRRPPGAALRGPHHRRPAPHRDGM
ncbi:MAG: hypothetical protein AVDCRST_MAG89-3593, partial [uncultured Gemmatimonadetes bacterium]